MIKEQKFLEVDAEGVPLKVYQRMKMPMMSERESLIDNSIRKLDGEYEGRYMWIQKSYEDPAYPVKKDAIRVSMYKAYMLWEEDGHAKAIEFSTFDMGGYFPMRLLNMAFGSMMKKIIEEAYGKMKVLQSELESTGSSTGN